ncbi:MAG: DUF4287 domain-containing protein [Planctomycetota bacterium]
MADPAKAVATQLANIEQRTGKTLKQLFAILQKSGLTKHGEMVAMLKADLGMGHGDANTLVHTFRAEADGGANDGKVGDGAGTSSDPLDAIYAGSKAPLRPLHEAVMTRIAKLGEFEIAPKKANVSLRRKKQFALIGPASKGRLEIGLNMRDVEATERLVAQPPGGMCQYKVFLTDAKEIDKELLGWVKIAYDSAG